MLTVVCVRELWVICGVWSVGLRGVWVEFLVAGASVAKEWVGHVCGACVCGGAHFTSGTWYMHASGIKPSTSSRFAHVHCFRLCKLLSASCLACKVSHQHLNVPVAWQIGSFD